MFTELIISKKLVTVEDVEKYILTTKSGAEVWCNKKQLSPSDETVTFTKHKQGDKYIDSEGNEQEFKQSGTKFVGTGKQVVEKLSTKELFIELHALGITPQLAA